MSAAPLSPAEFSYTYGGPLQEAEKHSNTSIQIVSQAFRQLAASLSLEEPEVVDAVNGDHLFKQLFLINEICFHDYLPQVNNIDSSYQSIIGVLRILANPALKVPVIKGENGAGCRYVYFRVEIPLISKSIITIFNNRDKPTTWIVSEKVYEGVLFMEKDIVMIDEGKVTDPKCYLKYQGIFRKYFESKII